MQEQEQIREEARRKKQLENDALVAFSEYTPLIKRKVTNNWIREAATPDSETGVIVEIDRSGAVLSVTLTESSGSSEFDRSVLLAVRKASPLPIPDNPDYYDYLRKFRFVFRSPETSS